MTLCIGALAITDPDPNAVPGATSVHCAIMSYDRRISGAGVIEVGHKYHVLAENWRGMFSGTVSDCREVLRRMAEHLRRHEAEITEANAMDHLREPLRAHCAALGIEHVQQEFLVVGCINGAFHLYRYYCSQGGYQWFQEDSVGSIGEGWYMADALLLGRDKVTAREDRAITFAGEMLYRVYEAQRFGIAVNSVGANAAMRMLTHENGKVREREIRTADRFDELWDKYGLRPIASNPIIRTSEFEWYEHEG